jgi:3-oxoacyl-[acyl-carrier protein] reductase
MIILTGASGGIGKAILPMLAKLDNVIAIYHSKYPDIKGLDGVSAYQMDITSENQVNKFIEIMKGKLAKPVLIHAAALSRDGLVADYDTEDWEQVINVNLRGDFLLTKATLKLMISENWGRIIHISSVAGMRGIPGTIAYSTAKTGLIGMSRVLANEYARFGITSNVIILGYFNTGLIETLSEKMRNKIIGSIPSGHLGEPKNIVNAIDFIMKSEYANGSSISLDGGI